MSVHLGARDVLALAVERESATVTEVNAATEVAMPLDTLRMLADQLYTVLMTLEEGESFDILVGSGSGEGLDSWRCLHKRWDTLTTGRARGLPSEILAPGRAKLVELQRAVELLEDLMIRYTQRRDAWNGQRHALAEDVRMAALEALLPEELERHCQLQWSRLDTYQKLREEVVSHAEARGYVAPKLGKDVAKSSGQPNMHKVQGQYWNCWKTGHQSKDCWAAATEPRRIKFFWKGKRRERQVWQRWKERQIQRCWGTCWNQQTEIPVASSVTSSVPQSETSATVGTIDTIECTSLDLCAQELVHPRWIAFNVDTGAGGTVWPMDADYTCERISGPAGRNYRTATGEMVEGKGQFRVRCQSVWRHQLHMTGERRRQFTNRC